MMMNKPDGVISATYDNKLKTVIDILPDEYKPFNLFPAGRLDIDTEGLLLMTNDGQLAHEMLAPKKHVPKKYFAHIDKAVDGQDITAFDEGITLDDGYKTLPAKLSVVGKEAGDEVEIVIYEGKFHQIKRMFEARGKKVLYLKRMQMGSLKLDEKLKTGGCRELTDDEINSLKAGMDKQEWTI
jgi:16S rRNA pseudouridine516 synthase